MAIDVTIRKPEPISVIVRSLEGLAEAEIDMQQLSVLIASLQKYNDAMLGNISDELKLSQTQRNNLHRANNMIETFKAAHSMLSEFKERNKDDASD